MQVENHVFKAMIHAFEDVLADDTNASRDRRRKDGQFHFIPFDLDQFFDQVHQARIALMTLRAGDFQQDAMKFIDAGCGVGTKVLAARTISSYHHSSIDPYGIEIDPKYVKAARKLLRSYFGPEDIAQNIIEGDAINHHYGRYDIVYFYRPLCDLQLELKLEGRILSTAKKGSIIIANGCSHEQFRGDGKMLRNISGNHPIFLRI